MSEDAMAEDGEMMDAAANLVGAACGDYAAAVPDGAGSVEAMSQDPVAVAASNNPLLSSILTYHVIPRGVQTANATVYLVDTVLMPPAN